MTPNIQTNSATGTQIIPTLLTKSEAASFLRISQTTLDRLVRNNQLPAIRIGKSVRFDRDQIVKQASC